MKRIIKILPFALVLLLGFTEQANLVTGNWYQQFLPPINNRPISDITFIDSLTGFAVTPYTANDTAYILKTTNGGDNWNVVFKGSTNIVNGFNKIQFINLNTGFCGSGAGIFKTTNSGQNWSLIANQVYARDMYVLSENTIWTVDDESLAGGVFLTTTGGASWTHQLNIGSSNPEKIYMFNARIGYISKNLGSSGYVRKTTDGGASWNLIVSNDYFLHIYFADSLTGWKNSAFGMKKTTDGGLNWVLETIPSGGIIQNSFIGIFSGLNRDTLWGAGGSVMYPNGQIRGILYRTINGGANWLFQIPDTSINIGYAHITFTDKMHGWVYGGTATIQTGIHTTTGGDPIWLTGIKQISTEVPVNYKLYQNFPNPFNPSTVISYQLRVKSYVKMSVYDITGKHITDLVNQKQTAGTYQVDFSGNGYSSGIYFYSLLVNDQKIETRKMILIK